MYQYPDYLMHHGILGMKWGVRKAKPVSQIRSEYDSAKSAKKRAWKSYSKAYDKAWNRPFSGYTKSGRKLWDKAYTQVNRYNKEASRYKTAKENRRTALKTATGKVRKNSSLGEKLIFNSATRDRAAKYMVDNDMSLKDAKHKATSDAIRNTGLLAAGLGAYYVVDGIYRSTH
jgi:hypothetical protein